FEEGRDAQLQVGVDDLVDVGEGVAHAPLAGVFVGLVDARSVAEQAVASDVAEADLPLHEGERLVVVAPQREVEPAGADAVAPGVGEPGCRLPGDGDPHGGSFAAVGSGRGTPGAGGWTGPALARRAAHRRETPKTVSRRPGGLPVGR